MFLSNQLKVRDINIIKDEFPGIMGTINETNTGNSITEILNDGIDKGISADKLLESIRNLLDGFYIDGFAFIGAALRLLKYWEDNNDVEFSTKEVGGKYYTTYRLYGLNPEYVTQAKEDQLGSRIHAMMEAYKKYNTI